jgi:hypothetical protein
MRTFPTSFAQNCKTSFVHPDIYASGLPTSIREIHALCKLHTQIRHEERNAIIVPLLRQKFTKLNRRYSGALDFEELLGCSQALLHIQCIVALNEDNQARYSESVADMLEGIGSRLWERAPVQLPPTLS